MIDVRSLTKTFSIGKNILTAVKNVSFQIQTGKTLGLVGESGCGKSTLGRLLVRLEKPTVGQFFFEGKDISLSKDRALCRQIQMIFQDPFSSLNPRMTVKDLIREPLQVHRLPEGNVVEELLDLVGLPKNAKSRFPHEFSGGQKQRIGIARALALHPKFIICDEPIAALDVSIQAQIIGLLQRLQKELHLTYLFIAHDLAIVRQISTHIAIMYLGALVEVAPTDLLFQNPLHPYTQLLLYHAQSGLTNLEQKKSQIFERAARRNPGPSGPGQASYLSTCGNDFRSLPERRISVFQEGVLQELPPEGRRLSLLPPLGCAFSNRCPKAMPICRVEAPPLIQIGKDQKVACHLYSFPK